MRFLNYLGAPFSGRVVSSSSPPQPDGYYYVIQASGTPPAPTDPSWLPTTKLNDVGVNDHTTYESTSNVTSPTNFVIGMSYVAAGQLWQTYTASAGYTNTATVNVLYWNDSAWATWDSPPVGLHGGMSFTDFSRDPTDRTSIAVCFGVADAGLSGGPFEARLADFRPA